MKTLFGLFLSSLLMAPAAMAGDMLYCRGKFLMAVTRHAGTRSGEMASTRVSITFTQLSNGVDGMGNPISSGSCGLVGKPLKIGDPGVVSFTIRDGEEPVLASTIASCALDLNCKIRFNDVNIVSSPTGKEFVFNSASGFLVQKY